MKTQLNIHFNGYFQCRLATFPDPNTHPKGEQGYTCALEGESDLDRIICLQEWQVSQRDIRKPYDNPIGVHVSRVFLEEEVWEHEQLLLGSEVRLLSPGFNGPVYEVPMDGVRSFDGRKAIVPFQFQIESDSILLRRDAPLGITAVKGVEYYGDRLCQGFLPNDEEVLGILGTEDLGGYFSQRKQWLETQLLNETDDAAKRNYQRRIDLICRNSRKFVIEGTTPPMAGWMEDRTGIKVSWEFPIRGDYFETSGLSNLGSVNPEEPWHIRFWMGAFEDDLMRGYMKGHVSIPFEKKVNRSSTSSPF